MMTSTNECPVCGGKEWNIFWIDRGVTAVLSDCDDDCIVDLVSESHESFIDECAKCGTTITGLDPGVIYGDIN